ncbi:HCL316Wp [Eremothecium sinecaudum]|uniref:HCL316Wp n=1 Tax=Eremothecium sinecaudum TaxID=45286 RepID=A0A109UYG3_9SACH|nr:HCL316Wp [Eremothecium sinecaudum]AMD19835.1 HCL316Wp [Eremothecium sinecaudum]
MVWKRAKASDGRVYYYDTVTQTTSWERPVHISESDDDEGTNNGHNNEQKKVGLINQYSSSSEDEGELSGDGEADNEEGATADVSKEEEEDSMNDQKEKFFELLDRYSLDPYSSWGLQALTINSDPVFFVVEDDATREEYFEQWCAKKVAKGSPAEVEDINEEEVESSDGENNDSLTPTKFHYLAHIVSKATVDAQTVFSDIKSKHKALFKTLNINENLTKADQKAFVSKLLFYYKKLDLSQREGIFNKLLDSCGSSIKKNLEQNRAFEDFIDEELLPEDAYSVETQLFTMESCIGLHDTLSQLQDNERYYVLGIKDKTKALKSIIRKFQIKQ